MARIAYCIFCDDVRHESTGKRSLIGVYNYNIIVPKFPAVIERMFVLVTLRTPIDDDFSSAAYRVEIPGHDPVIQRFGGRSEVPMQNWPGNEEHPPKYHLASAVIPLGPLELAREGRIRVYSEVDGEELYAGSLLIVDGSKRSEDEVSVNLDETLRALLNYRLVSERPDVTDDIRQHLAAKLLDTITQRFPPPPDGLPPQAFHILLPDQRVQVIFPIPKDAPPGRVDIVDIDPDEKTWEIESIDRFGFVVHFPDGIPESFDFNVPE